MSRKPVVHVVTIATCTRPELAYLLVSADQHGITPILLALGDPRLSFYNREYSVKPHAVRQWLEKHLLTGTGNVHPSDLVVHVDAFDVIIQRNAEAIEAGWRAAGSPPILLSAEKNLTPRQNLRGKFDAATPRSPYRYPNAGTFMGTAQALLDFLSTPIMRATGDDQGMLQDAWEQYHDTMGIALDSARDVFHVTVWDEGTDLLASTSPIMHFAGPGGRKPLVDFFKAKFPFLQQPQVDTTYWRHAVRETKAKAKTKTSHPKTLVLPLSKSASAAQASMSVFLTTTSMSTSTSTFDNHHHSYVPSLCVTEEAFNDTRATVIALATLLAAFFIACIVLASVLGTRPQCK